MKKLFFILFLINFFNLYSQEKYEDFIKSFTTLKKGDIISLYDNSKKIDAHIYIFMEAASCPACNLSIKPYFFNILKKYKIDAVIFINGADEEFANELKKKYSWDINMVVDKMGAFANLFKIKRFPFFIVSDGEGKILTMDKMGGVHIEPEDVERLIDSSKKAKLIKKNGKELIQEFKKIPIIENGKPVKAGKFRNFLYNSKRNEYYCFLGWNLPLYIIDSLGNIKKTIDKYSNNDTIDSYLIFNLDWIKPDSILIIFQTDLITQKQYITSYKLNDDKFKFINFCNYLEDRSGYEKYYIPESNKFIVSMNFSPNVTKKINNQTLVNFIYDTTMNLINRFSLIDSIYSALNISTFFDSYIVIDTNKNIVIYQAYSNKLIYYDMDGTLIKIVNLKFPDTHKIFKKELPEKLTNEIFDSLLFKISLENYMLYDKIKNRYAIQYMNYYKVDSLNENASDVDRYLHICDTNGKNIFPEDIKLPKDTYVFYIADDLIYTSTVIDNNLMIIIYKIKT